MTLVASSIPIWRLAGASDYSGNLGGNTAVVTNATSIWLTKQVGEGLSSPFGSARGWQADRLQ